MRTQAVRLDDDTIAMIDLAARLEGSKPSDIIREGIREILTQKARKHEELAALRTEAVARRDAEHERAKAQALGEAP